MAEVEFHFIGTPAECRRILMRDIQKAGSFVGGMAIGMTLMYLADPERGPRRRALIRDQALHALESSREFLAQAGSDLRHRAQGLAATARQRLHHEEMTDDEVLVERVRSRLGHHTTHAHAIEVTADGGSILLEGAILAEELEGVLKAVLDVPGVEGVDNRLQQHAEADIPELQGGAELEEEHQRVWTPGIQLLAGLGIATAVVLGTQRMRSAHSWEYVDS